MGTVGSGDGISAFGVIEAGVSGAGTPVVEVVVVVDVDGGADVVDDGGPVSVVERAGSVVLDRTGPDAVGGRCEFLAGREREADWPGPAGSGDGGETEASDSSETCTVGVVGRPGR